MKKVICLLIALVMLLSLALMYGCSTNDDPLQDAQPHSPAPASPSPNDYNTESTSPTTTNNDEEFFIGVVCPSLEGEWLNSILTSFCRQVEEWGCTSQLLSAESDNANYIQIMENYLTMGADLILNVAMETEAVKDITLRCIDEGCYVIMLGIWPEYEISGGIITDFYNTGVACADMLIDWVNINMPDAAPDSVPVAAFLTTNIADGVKRSNGFVETLNAAEKTYVDYEEAQEVNSIDNGFNFAENAMTYNSDIRCFITYEVDPGIGVNNYLSQFPEYDLSEFCVVGVGQTEAALSLVEQASADPSSSALRGMLAYGGEDPGITLNKIAYDLLVDGVEPPHWIYDDMYTFNTWGWEVPTELLNT